MHSRARRSRLHEVLLECHAKGEAEIAMWQDSQLIVSYNNAFSSERCGLLSRGAHGDKDSFSVYAPEAIWHYNVEGRRSHPNRLAPSHPTPPCPIPSHPIVRLHTVLHSVLRP